VHYDVTSGRSQAKHRIKTIGISSLVILLLLVGVGAAYTWYNGQQPASIAKVPASNEPQAKQIVPKTLDKNVQESAAVQTVTSPIAPGENAMISIKTNPTSNCKISAVYNNVAAVDSGLAPRKADNFGTVNWAWTVPKGTPLGSWPITVTCEYYGKSAVVTQDLRVQATSTAN
jgi:hypothetical protein